MIRQQTYWLAVAVVLLLLAFTTATAGSPQIISHQGYLTSSDGIALTGTHSLSFSLYDVAAGGAALWSETHAVVEVTDGLYSLLLGSISPLTPAVFSGPNRYLGVSIDGGAELTPRRQIAATAFALRSDRAANADSLNGQAPSFYLRWENLTGVPAGFADGTDNVGSGDITGVTAGEGLMGGGASGTVQLDLDTAGVLTKHIANNTITNDDINASAAIGVGKISGTAMNLTSSQTVTATKTFDGTVYFGDSTMRIDNNGIRIGSSSLAPSSTYLLLVDRHVSTASTRYGIRIDMDNLATGTVYGVYGRASGATAGAANSGNVYGLYGVGISDGEDRYGGYFSSRSRTTNLATGTTTGIYAKAQYGGIGNAAEFLVSDVDNAYGIRVDVSRNGDGTGIYTMVMDNTQNVSAIGSNNFVLSNAGTGYGVAGTVGNNGSIGYAVYGHAYGNSTNWSGYFTGDVNVAGTLFMPAKITKIDHPLDPENQNLLLSGIDSPEMLVKSSGNVTTDASGAAIVTLPAYFTAMAANFRYQLTVIGEFAQAIIGEEVIGNQFRIKTDKPNIKVSWEITGERSDNFAKSHPLVIETAKPADQRGRYLHPEAFGVAPERGVTYQIQQELEGQQPQRRDHSTDEEEPELR